MAKKNTKKQKFKKSRPIVVDNIQNALCAIIIAIFVGSLSAVGWHSLFCQEVSEPCLECTATAAESVGFVVLFVLSLAGSVLTLGLVLCACGEFLCENPPLGNKDGTYKVQP